MPGPAADGIDSHMLKLSLNALPLPLYALLARQQRQPAQRTAVMPSALRHQPHSWSDDPAELPSLAGRVIEEGPAALTGMIKVSAGIRYGLPIWTRHVTTGIESSPTRGLSAAAAAHSQPLAEDPGANRPPYVASIMNIIYIMLCMYGQHHILQSISSGGDDHMLRS